MFSLCPAHPCVLLYILGESGVKSNCTINIIFKIDELQTILLFLIMFQIVGKEACVKYLEAVYSGKNTGKSHKKKVLKCQKQAHYQ